MRHFEIVHKGLSKSEPPAHPSRTATLFVPRALSEACIVIIEEHGSRVVKTRVLTKWNGFSVDVEAPTPSAASELLFAWWDYCVHVMPVLS
jgi:hypothetical protein